MYLGQYVPKLAELMVDQLGQNINEIMSSIM